MGQTGAEQIHASCLHYCYRLRSYTADSASCAQRGAARASQSSSRAAATKLLSAWLTWQQLQPGPDALGLAAHAVRSQLLLSALPLACSRPALVKLAAH